jgi:hypothetical protein
MLLFDDFERTETRMKRARESTFAYLNSSSRAPIAAARGMLQQWFDSYPEAAQRDLLARFRSPIDAQHKSAFWELYLHELFSRLGFSLEPHPDIEHSANHPDFLVKQGETPKFYLEGIVAGLPSAQDAGAEARLAEVFDLINKMEPSAWFLQVEYRGQSGTPPPVKRLRKDLEAWLATQDLKAIDDALQSEDWDGLPRFEWQHEGLTLSFVPVPKSPEGKAKTDSRLVGMVMGEAHILKVDEDIRRAVRAKSKKYGTLPLPLVVAVNVLSEHCDDIDINNALFGTETVVVTTKPDGSHGTSHGRRLPDGVWFGTKGARNQAVSAVLIGNNINPYTCGIETPLLIHHPYPTHPLVLSSYPLPESLPDETTRIMKRKEGRHAKDFVRLPSPWPPAQD